MPAGNPPWTELGQTSVHPNGVNNTGGEQWDIFITAKITRSLDPIGPARLRYRVMYGPEIELTMLDDGLNNDGAAGDGVYGATIPASASAPGEMVRWRIISEDSNGDITRSPPYQDPLDSPEYWGTVIDVPNVVAGGQLGVLHWFTADTSGADTSGGSRGSMYFNGQFFDNISTDLHGQSSAGFPKKSYDFKLNTSFKLGWDPVVANNTPKVNSFNLLTTYPDKAALRNILAYEVFDTAGVAGHTVLPIQVRRNNAFFSHTHFVEDGDEDFLQREPGLDDLGALYKMYNTFYDVSGAEKKSRRLESNADLAAFITGLNNANVTNRTRFIYDNAAVPETINYLAAQIITGNDDVGHKNYYVYRDTMGNREWRPLPWDVDLSFGRVWRPATNYFGDDMVADTSLFVGNGNLFMQQFLNNSIPVLRQMYLRRLRTLCDNILNQSSLPLANRYLENRLDALKLLVKPEADYERVNNIWPSWGTPQTIDQAVDLIKDTYLPARRTYVYAQPELPAAQSPTVVINFGSIEFDPASHNQAEEYFTLTNANTEAVDVSGWVIGGGVNHVLKQGTVIPASGTLYLSPDINAFRARTTGVSGNQGLFVQGNYSGQLSARGETLTLTDGVRLVSTLTYTGDPTAAQTNLRITEIMYNPGLLTGSTFDRGEYEYIELRNISSTLTLDLTGVRFTAGSNFSFTSGTMLAPGAYAVVEKNSAGFAQRYPSTTSTGIYIGALNNGGDRITLLDADNEEIHDFSYQDTWHPLTDGPGFSLQIVDQAALFSAWELSTQWRPSGKLHGTPGADDSTGDFDGDGMSDLWEAQNGLNPENPADANLDLDFDGQTNLEEFTAGTIPGSSVSRFAITSNIQSGGDFNGSFPGVAGKTYTVQYSESMGSASWQNLSNHAPTVSGAVPFTDTPPANHPRRFYRVVTPQVP